MLQPQRDRHGRGIVGWAAEMMGAAISFFRDFRNAALGFMIVNVIALYGAALAYPVDRGAPKVPAFGGGGEVRVLDAAAIARFVADPPRLVAVSTARLESALDSAEYRLDQVRRGRAPVPRLFLATIPRDFKSVDDPATRKALFMRASLPLILQVNEEIMVTRRHLLRLHDQVRAGHSIPDAERYWLAALARKYGAAADDLEALLVRVDAISPALAMAQAALESGWGQSRFAVDGNALFGQRTWRSGGGIVPTDRAAGKSFEVKHFERLIDGVRDYALNLNRHAAYSDFRAMRAAMRAAGEPLDSYALVTGLEAYSERGVEYIEMLQLIMRANALEHFEAAQLEGGWVTQVAGR